MRRAICTVAAFVLTGRALVAPPPLTGPASGTWKATVSTRDTTLAPQEICYEDPVGPMTHADIFSLTGQACSGQSFDPNSTSLHVACSFGAVSTNTDIVITGGYASAYTIDLTTSTLPAPEQPEAPLVIKVRMERLGACDSAP